VGLVLLAIVGIGAYVVLNSGGLIKSAIEDLGPDYLGASVNVGSVDLSLTDGSARIMNLRIGNPTGYDGAYAMQVGDINVKIDTAQTTEKLIVLNQVSVDNVDIAAVARGQKINFQQLMDNLDAATGPGSSDVKFIIDKLDLTGAKASLNSDILGDVALNIPDIHLKAVGRSAGGATGAEIAEQVLKPITNAVTREAVNKGLDIEGVKSRVQDKIRDRLGEGLRSLTDRLKK
jgi:hypothetical protein